MSWLTAYVSLVRDQAEFQLALSLQRKFMVNQNVNLLQKFLQKFNM